MIKLLTLFLMMSSYTFAMEFYLKIDLTLKERSKDSHSQHHILEITDQLVQYQYRYSGFPAKSQKSKEFKLSLEKLQEIKTFIQKHGLNRAVEEKSSFEGIGSSVALMLTLDMDNQHTQSQISGCYRSFAKSVNPIQNLQYVEDAKELIQKLTLMP